MFGNSFSLGSSGYSDASNYGVGKAQQPSVISYDTSSKDPLMLRSRIFVGGLNTNTVSRDDVIQLFSSYGTILGVTLFKGYAFVQYSTIAEAELAVSALNLYQWHGSALDVKTVTKDQKNIPSNAVSTSSNGIGKRPAQSDHANEVKKGRQQMNSSRGPQKDARSEYAEIPDTFICGLCRFTTIVLEQFVNHRKSKCNRNMGMKADGEPEVFNCCSCVECFSTGWDLIHHLSKSHNLAVYRNAVKDSEMAS